VRRLGLAKRLATHDGMKEIIETMAET